VDLRPSASKISELIRRRCGDPWNCYSDGMISNRTCFLLAIIGSMLVACTGGTSEITARDVIGKYKGVGYSGLGMQAHPVGMNILPDGTFTGDISVPDGYVRHTGKWNFGKYIEASQCREVEFRTDGHLLGIKCASVDPDGITGFDCGIDQECTMRRYAKFSHHSSV